MGWPRWLLARLRLPPYVDFPVADVRVSLWMLMLVGLATIFDNAVRGLERVAHLQSGLSRYDRADHRLEEVLVLDVPSLGEGIAQRFAAGSAAVLDPGEQIRRGSHDAKSMRAFGQSRCADRRRTIARKLVSGT